MGNERSYADHMRLQGHHEDNIFIDVIQGLTGSADHDPASYLEPDLLKVIKAHLTLCTGHRFRMEHGIVLFVCRLVSEEVSVRTRLEILSIALLGLLSD